MKKNLEKELCVITASDWQEYALLDSGNRRKLERFGAYRVIRPEKQAIWKPGLAAEDWESAHVEFIPGKGEKGGKWVYKQQIPHSWSITYNDLVITVQAKESRNVGVFPEHATHWDWMRNRIKHASHPVNILNLFGYTGIASIASASAGANITHVDASRSMVRLGRDNQEKSGYTELPVRWIVDDVNKFVKRENRRGKRYDGILMDPPRFGRGPRGEVWEVVNMLPGLLDECSKILVSEPLLFLVTAYAAPISAITLENLLSDMMQKHGGKITAGEMAIMEESQGRMLPTAVFARWTNSKDNGLKSWFQQE